MVFTVPVGAHAFTVAHQNEFFQPDNLTEYKLRSWQSALLQLDHLSNKIWKENHRAFLLNGARRAEIHTDQRLVYRGLSYRRGASCVLALFQQVPGTGH